MWQLHSLRRPSCAFHFRLAAVFACGICSRYRFNRAGQNRRRRLLAGGHGKPRRSFASSNTHQIQTTQKTDDTSVKILSNEQIDYRTRNDMFALAKSVSIQTPNGNVELQSGSKLLITSPRRGQRAFSLPRPWLRNPNLRHWSEIKRA